ncbi:MAG: hypothetical protein ACRCYV_03590 [Aeromonas sp.]
MLLFPFAAVSGSDPALKEVAKQFKQGGAQVVQAEVMPSIKRTSGMAFREIVLTFADSQLITLRIKESGDIFQALINKKLVPLRAQTDHAAAIKELIALLNRGRAAFQRQQAKAKVALPSAVKTAAPTIEALLLTQKAELSAQIAAVDNELAQLAAA